MTSGDSSVTNSGNKGALEELAIRRCRNNSSWGTMRAGERAGFSFSTVIPTGVDSLDENATWAHVKSNRRKRIKSMETASLGARPRALLCSLLLSDHPIENIHRTRALPGKKEREREREEPSHFSRMWFKSSHKRRRCAELQAACSSVGR